MQAEHWFPEHLQAHITVVIAFLAGAVCGSVYVCLGCPEMACTKQLAEWLVVLLLLCKLSVCIEQLSAGGVATFKMMSYNIRHGSDINGVLNLSRTAAAITAEDVDVVALQEVDNATLRVNGLEEPQLLVSITPSVHHCLETLLWFECVVVVAAAAAAAAAVRLVCHWFCWVSPVCFSSVSGAHVEVFFVSVSTWTTVTERKANLTGLLFIQFDKNRNFDGGGYGTAILTRLPVVNATNFHFVDPKTGKSKPPSQCQELVPQDYCQGASAVRLQIPTSQKHANSRCQVAFVWILSTHIGRFQQSQYSSTQH